MLKNLNNNEIPLSAGNDEKAVARGNGKSRRDGRNVKINDSGKSCYTNYITEHDKSANTNFLKAKI